ncbi:MAG: helix-turn-helix domain-containing protein [Planctomycetota bacterium]
MPDHRDALRLAQSQPGAVHQQLVHRYIAAIAAAVGYADPLYFSRVFRRHSGCSPRSLRQGLRQLEP